MLKAFVEKLGHEYSPLSDGAMKAENNVDVRTGDDDDDDEILVQAATDQIKASAWNDDSSEDEARGG